MSDTKYNGWSNYETWRVNLEMFDCYDLKELIDEPDTEETYFVGQQLKEHAQQVIECSAPEGLARDYALAFLDAVNWREIAQHLIDEYVLNWLNA